MQYFAFIFFIKTFCGLEDLFNNWTKSKLFPQYCILPREFSFNFIDLISVMLFFLF